jgi:CMP-N,N'-diacetyllegionaminic acid synthase
LQSRNVIFIPARAGSKGIPGKNLVLLNNRPLIEYTFEIIKKLSENAYPFVSTDCSEVLSLASTFGFDTEYKRPSSLAQDDSSIMDVVLHGIDWLKNSYKLQPTNIVLLQPTSPLRTVDQVSAALEIFDDKKLESLVSVHEMREHPYECSLGKDDNWTFVKEPNVKVVRRQDYAEKFYYIDGSIYMASVDFLLKNKSFLKAGETYLFETESRFNIDIDEPEDLVVAEALMKFRNNNNRNYGK